MPLLKIWKSLRGRAAEAKPAREATDDAPAARSSRATKPARGLLRRAPHSPLRRLVKPLSVGSVLEISIGDGATAAAVLETLAKRNADIQYAAIDQFELSGGPITLKQFHQNLRHLNIRPRIFPDTIECGLMRVANTIGAVDLVLIGAAPEDWQIPSVLSLLGRVTHSDSVVLHVEGDQWSRFEPPSLSRRAA